MCSTYLIALVVLIVVFTGNILPKLLFYCLKWFKTENITPCTEILFLAEACVVPAV